jgi:D-cysteine desulfhydrase
MTLTAADRATALATLARREPAGFGHFPTPIDRFDRFAAAAGLSQRILAKRDDAITFGFGGNKVRKLRYVIPDLRTRGVDTVITCGGVQSNHARATAAAATVSGMACHLVVNGAEPARPTGNALIGRLLGATFEYVSDRAGRNPAMAGAADRFRAAGRTPAIVPLGASNPLGALGYVAAVGELIDQGLVPDVIVHASSSGGTSAGLLAGVALHGLATRVIGISADDPPDAIIGEVRSIVAGLGPLLGIDESALAAAVTAEVDDAFVGPGYGQPTAGSTFAQETAARTEGVFVDHTYSAKALAGLVAYCRDRRIQADATVLFWHTGGQVALFA